MLEATPSPDGAVQVASDGDHVVVVTASDEGVIAGFAADGGGRFEAGEPTVTGVEFLHLGGVARFAEGWVALGSGGLRDDGEPLFAVQGFRSADGQTWSPVEATGLDRPGDVTGVVAVEGGLVAAGMLRTAELPSQGGFVPVAWHSPDGEGWTAVLLPPGGGDQGSVFGLAVTGGEVVAVGEVGGAGVVWASADRGASWDVVRRDGLPATSSVNDIAAQGNVLVASVTAAGREASQTASPSEGVPVGEHQLWRSDDGGQHWRAVAQPPPANRGETVPFPLFAGGGRFFTLGYSFIDGFADPELCYADLQLCQVGATVALYASDDGDRWRRIDTSGVADGDGERIEAVTATGAAQAVVLGRVADGVGVWTWAAGAPLPDQDEPVDPTTDVEVLGEQATPQVGRRYGLPLYIHCGMEWLYVAGQPWQRTDDGPDVETGAGDAVPAGWPVAQQTIFGYVTLVSGDLIEYSLEDGEVIATYAPATQPPGGCA